MRLLVIQPDHLGDILLSQPAVALLRECLPHHRLIAVVGPWSTAITERAWPVDDIAAITFPGFTRGGDSNLVDPYRQVYRDARKLRSLNASTAIAMRSDAWWSAWLASLSVPFVIGSDDPRVAPFTSIAVRTGRGHVTTRALRLAESAIDHVEPACSLPAWAERPCVSIAPDVDARQQAHHLLTANRIDGPYVVIHPGSGAPVKAWPIHRWRHVARNLSELGLHVVVTGSAAEAPLARDLVYDLESIVSVAGETPLPVLIELLRGARLVLGPDCGPLHLAVATNTPSIHLFGPSDPNIYGPCGDPARHLVVRSEMSCSRCGDLSLSRPEGCGCMLAIDADRILNAARRLLSAF